MKIHHLGAKDCVTGSCHLVQTIDGMNILVDCGKAYGNDPELSFDRFPVLPRDIDYLFLTHAHIVGQRGRACYSVCMPRKSRIDAPGALHHIIARGIESQNRHRFHLHDHEMAFDRLCPLV